MDRKCFFGICTNRTKDECIERNLFGDKIPRYDTVAEGDVGILLNVSNDTAIGIFSALGPARERIVPMAWDGKFPIQIRVRPIGRLQTLRHATQKLENIIKLISVRRRAYKMPQLRVHGPDVTRRILHLFPHVPHQLKPVENSPNKTMALLNLLDLPPNEDMIFENAKALYGDYEQNENLDSLTEALDLLTGSEVASNPKLHNLKITICRDINSKLRKIMQRYNIKEFAENMSNPDEIMNLVAGSLSERDLTKFVHLLEVKIDYCG